MLKKILRALPIIVVVIVLIICIAKPELISNFAKYVIAKFNSWFVPAMTDAMTDAVTK